MTYSLAERIGMSEARNVKLQARLIKQEAMLAAMQVEIDRMKAAMRGILRPIPAPIPVEIEDNPALTSAALSAARMSEIAAKIALLHDLTVIELRGPSRRVRESHPRQEAMMIMHKAGYSLSRIGRYFRRDHTTVLHGIRAAMSRMDKAPE